MVVTFHPSCHTDLLPHQVQRAAPPCFPRASLPKGNREKDGGLTTAPVNAVNLIPPSSLHSEFPYPQQTRQMLAASSGSVRNLHAKGDRGPECLVNKPFSGQGCRTCSFTTAGGITWRCPAITCIAHIFLSAPIM